MGASAKPWTQAIEGLLADGEVHKLEDVLNVGAAEVTAERALQEMGSKQSGHSEEKRIATGQRNVAMQAVTGMVRFGKAKYVEGRTSIKWVGKDSTSLGDVMVELAALKVQVAELLDWKESAQAELDRLEAQDEERAQESPAQNFLAAAGVPASG